MLVAQETTPSEQLAQHSGLRIMAKEAAFTEVASSKLRRLLAHNESFSCAALKIGGSQAWPGEDIGYQ